MLGSFLVINLKKPQSRKWSTCQSFKKFTLIDPVKQPIFMKFYLMQNNWIYYYFFRFQTLCTGWLEKICTLFMRLLPFLLHIHYIDLQYGKFCRIFGNIFKNCEKCSYEEIFALFWQVAEMANKPIYKVLVNLKWKNTIKIQYFN